MISGSNQYSEKRLILEAINKILIANRGEIAVRIIRAAKKNGIRSVAVYAPDDADSLHVSMADESFLLSGNTLAETYLNQEKLIELALKLGASAIHPGYGFLAENAGFAQRVQEAGLIFVGPSPENIRLMGEKNQALDFVRSLGIPVLPSFRGHAAKLLKLVPELEYPVVVKASGGGGGKGIVICQTANELPDALHSAEKQAIRYFSNGELFIEKYLPQARHVEVQLIADHFGNVVHLFERECSVQRHFQKIIEEAPSPSVDENLRNKLAAAAVRIAQSMNYRNAGTIEFLLDPNGNFYFLEMNTRIQVEHPVTEMITGVDLVSLQLLVAGGNPLPIGQEDIRINGHAIEVRLCAEDSEHHFLPSAGRLSVWNVPADEHLRVETFVSEGLTVSPGYDSLLAKLVVWNNLRESAAALLREKLAETFISGIYTNQSFLSGILASDEFLQNKIYTKYVDMNLDLINSRIQSIREGTDLIRVVAAYLYFQLFVRKTKSAGIWSQIGYWRLSSSVDVQVDGGKFFCELVSDGEEKIFRINQEKYRVNVVSRNENLLKLSINDWVGSFYCIENESDTQVLCDNFSFSVKSNLLISQVHINRKTDQVKKNFQNLIYADLFGKVLKIKIGSGDVVTSGQILLTLESMKTEIHVLAPVAGRVNKIHVNAGEAVTEKQLLIELEEN